MIADATTLHHAFWIGWIASSIVWPIASFIAYFAAASGDMSRSRRARLAYLCSGFLGPFSALCFLLAVPQYPETDWLFWPYFVLLCGWFLLGAIATTYPKKNRNTGFAAKSSNQSMQPTAGRRTASLSDE
jgi:hypothetical protein